MKDWETADLLVTAITVGGWMVDADNLALGANLMRRGYLDVADEPYEGPRFFPTDKGIAYAKRQGWIRSPTAEERREPYGNDYRRLLPTKKPKQSVNSRRNSDG